MKRLTYPLMNSIADLLAAKELRSAAMDSSRLPLVVKVDQSDVKSSETWIEMVRSLYIGIDKY